MELKNPYKTEFFMKIKYFNNINVGITSKCNAKCYLCNRRTIESFPLDLELPIGVFDKIIPYTDKIQIVGGFGDFINHSKSLEIAQKLKESNVEYLIETNGGIGDEQYWKELGNIVNGKGMIQFSIDDIKNDVNPYRKTNTDKVLNNLRNFVMNGGNAQVKTLVFNFNQCELDNMKEYFDQYDIPFFTQYSMYYPKAGKFSAPDNINHSGTLALIYSLPSQSTFSCPWNDGKWLLINEFGEVHPCCNILTFISGYKDRTPKELHEYVTDEMFEDIYELYVENKNKINLINDEVTLKSAYENKYNQYILNNFMNISRCKAKCSKINMKLETLLCDKKEYR